MRIELALCESTLLKEAADPAISQKSIALTYAMALRSSKRVDWAKVNAAILARWPKGLARIKTMAWRLVEAKSKEPQP